MAILFQPLLRGRRTGEQERVIRTCDRSEDVRIEDAARRGDLLCARVADLEVSAQRNSYVTRARMSAVRMARCDRDDRNLYAL